MIIKYLEVTDKNCSKNIYFFSPTCNYRLIDPQTQVTRASVSNLVWNLVFYHSIECLGPPT